MNELSKLYRWLHNKSSRSEERGKCASGYWHHRVRENMLRLCGPLKGDILEVGCGEGLFLSKLRDRNQNARIFGVDIWGEILLKLKVRFKESDEENISLIQADSCHLPFKDSLFDVTLCVNVFFNLPTDEIFYTSLREIMRVCKKSARIIFDIRNSVSPFIYLKYKLAKYYDETVRNFPLRTYRLSRVISYLNKYNFEVTNKIDVGFPHNAFAPIIIVEAVKK